MDPKKIIPDPQNFHLTLPIYPKYVNHLEHTDASLSPKLQLITVCLNLYPRYLSYARWIGYSPPNILLKIIYLHQHRTKVAVIEMSCNFNNSDCTVNSVADPVFFLSRILIFYPSQKRGGEKKIVVIPFFGAINFTKWKNYFTFDMLKK